MDVSLASLTGYAAGCIGLYSFVPQVVKCCRTGDVAAISLRMFAVRTFGLLLWTVYGYALGSLPVLIFSALGLVLSSVILFLKVRGSRRQPAGANCHHDLPEQKAPGTARTAFKRGCVKVSSSRSCRRSSTQLKIWLDWRRLSEFRLLLPVALPKRKIAARLQTRESDKTLAG